MGVKIQSNEDIISLTKERCKHRIQKITYTGNPVRFDCHIEAVIKLQ